MSVKDVQSRADNNEEGKSDAGETDEEAEARSCENDMIWSFMLKAQASRAGVAAPVTSKKLCGGAKIEMVLIEGRLDSRVAHHGG